MDNKRELCVICSQAITNPICERCHGKQLALWINDQPVEPTISRGIVASVRKKFTVDSHNDSFCIICSQEIVSVCTYCFFFKVESTLLESGLTPEVIEEFLQSFNYELYSEKYLPDSPL